MAINFDIPHTMSVAGLQCLERLANDIPKNGTVVDVGAFYGATTWVLSKTADPSASVYAIDTWKKAEWIKKRFESIKGMRKFTQAAFKHFTSDCSNITAIKGESPAVLKDWKDPIDLVSMDAVLGNPGFAENLAFFEQNVKPGGLICGEGYALRARDVVAEVDALAERWGTRPEVVGRIWSLRKPKARAKVSSGVYEGLKDLKGPQLKVTTDCDLAGPHTAPPQCWSGQLVKAGAMRSFKLDWENRIDGLDIEYKCATAGSPTGETVTSGEWCKANSARARIISVHMRLIGDKADEYELSFQAGFTVDGEAKYSDKLNSKIKHSDRWIKAPTKNAPISALRVFVEKKS